MLAENARGQAGESAALLTIDGLSRR